MQVRPPADATRSKRRPPASPAREVASEPERPFGLAELQRHVGNRALSSLLQAQSERLVQREAAPAPEKAGAEDVAYWDDVFRLARKRIVAKQFADAERLLRRVYEDPKFTTADSPGVVLNLALCRQAQGDFAEAMSLYQESMASPAWTDENRKELLEGLRTARLRQPGRASGAAAPKAEPPDVAYWDDVFRLARKRIAAKQFAEAEKLLRRVYEDPRFTTADSPGVVLNLALCRQQQGDFAEAISLYLESMASPVWTAENRKELLEGLRSARLGQAPRVSGTEVVTADPGDEAYWDDAFRLARKRIAAKQVAEAEKLLRRVYEDPRFTTADSPGVVLNLALCRQQQGDFAEAISLYQEALAIPKWNEENRRKILDSIRTARLKQHART